MSNRTLQLTDEVYQYLLKFSLRETAIQQALREETATLNTKAMQISPEQGQFMALILKLMGAKNTLEIGVYTGYSALTTALALPAEGKIIACDVSAEWTDIGKRYWKEAEVENKIDLRLSPALDTLDSLLHHNSLHNTFDFAFIDADKGNYSLYYEKCLRLIRPGGLIMIDNTLWEGDVANPAINDASTRAIRALNEKLLNDDRIHLSLLPLGDGLSLALKK